MRLVKRLSVDSAAMPRTIETHGFVARFLLGEWGDHGLLGRRSRTSPFGRARTIQFWRLAVPKKPGSDDRTVRPFRRPLASERHNTLEALRPWDHMDPPVSKRTWYRRRREWEL